MSGCFICDKHEDMSSVPGGVIAEDEHVVVSHLPLVTPQGETDAVYLGRLLLESRRHVEELADLTGDQAASLGQMASRAAAALRDAAGAEHVYAAVIGHGVQHLHMHLLPRYPGTPREFWWIRLDEWPDAPRGGAADVAELAARLRAAI